MTISLLLRGSCSAHTLPVECVRGVAREDQGMNGGQQASGNIGVGLITPRVNVRVTSDHCVLIGDWCGACTALKDHVNRVENKLALLAGEGEDTLEAEEPRSVLLKKRVKRMTHRKTCTCASKGWDRTISPARRIFCGTTAVLRLEP